ncbi:hypothetical protein V5799_030229 [Amblyomma americanum]|uniref:Uncharacterized protein n=1 Tax=Amblyomma americanum TaxID=6943 RepID=A0AAQ4ENX5_AMBAM
MAATPTKPTTPSVPLDEELALYWDPRYYRYFYAGVMTPPTGQLYNFKGAPIARPTDLHMWSVVQLVQADGQAPSSAPSSRSIIIERDERCVRTWTQGQRKRPNKGRRISWSSLEVPDLDTKAGSAEVRDPTRRKRLVFSWLCRVLCVTVSLLVEMAATVLFRLEGSTDETARRTTSSSIFEGELVIPPGPIFQPFFGRDTPSSPAVCLYTARTEGRFMGDVVDDPVTTAGSLYMGAAFEYSVSRDTEIVNLICLVSGEPPQLEELDCIENSSLSEYSSCRLCDSVVRCCYSLGKDLKLQNGNPVRAVAENATQARLMSEGRRAPISPEAADTDNGHDDLSERTPQDDLAGYGADGSVDPDRGTKGADYVASTSAGRSRSSSSTGTSASSSSQASSRRGISCCIFPDEGFELLEQLYRLPQSLPLPECIRAPVLLGGGHVQRSGGRRVSAVRRALSATAAN